MGTYTFFNLSQLIIRLSTKNIEYWIVDLHDPNHSTPSSLWLYGNEKFEFESSVVSGYFLRYQVEPTEVNNINQDNKPCITEDNKMNNMYDCITDYMYSALNCTLPWKKIIKDDQTCSSPEEYDHYLSESLKSFNYTTNYIENVTGCTPACRRVEYSTKLQAKGKSEFLDELELHFYFAKDEFLVKEQFYIYDMADLIADLGGYLGLLLGYSLLGFYEPLMDLIEHVSKKIKKICKKKTQEQIK